jgi:hypothetical protein
VTFTASTRAGETENISCAGGPVSTLMEDEVTEETEEDDDDDDDDGEDEDEKIIL